MTDKSALLPFYQVLSDADLLMHQSLLSAELGARLFRREVPWARPWSSPAALEVVKQPPQLPTPVIVQPPLEDEEQEEEDDGLWVKACNSARPCTCRYYLMHADENGERPSLDVKALFVNRGIDEDVPFKQTRAALEKVLTGKARSESIRVPEGRSIAYIKFSTHKAAAAAQVALERAGYAANFLKLAAKE